MDINRLKQEVFVCCPFDLLVNTYLPRFLEGHMNPEIGLNAGILDRFKWSKFKKVAGDLKTEGLSCTIHGPYTDLSIGAIDRKVRVISIERIKEALEIAALFGARSVVCHTGFDLKHYYSMRDRWIENALESLTILSDYASLFNIPIMLENVFDLNPAIHREIFDAIGSPFLGFCLDIGHIGVFSEAGLGNWLRDVGDRLGQLHLHDNNGVHDDHLAIGEGVMDFDGLFSWLYEKKKRPIMTLEPHNEKAVLPALKALARLLEIYPINLENSSKL
ncbi:MAG: TIM barrel protein [Nitrospiraceae bacterium]|nr:TIM barrel protein [Nitrospiraceae bacterium]